MQLIVKFSQNKVSKTVLATKNQNVHIKYFRFADNLIIIAKSRSEKMIKVIRHVRNTVRKKKKFLKRVKVTHFKFRSPAIGTRKQMLSWQNW